MNDSDITNAAIQEIAAILATGYLRYRRAQLAGPSPIDPVDCLQRQLQHEQESGLQFHEIRFLMGSDACPRRSPRSRRVRRPSTLHPLEAHGTNVARFEQYQRVPSHLAEHQPSLAAS